MRSVKSPRASICPFSLLTLFSRWYKQIFIWEDSPTGGKGEGMHLYRQLYEFAASAGALEGYVYDRKDPDMRALEIWVSNLKAAYALLTQDALDPLQPSVDQTLGRASQSLVLSLGEKHDLVMKLRSMVKGELPASPDDFQKQKWFQR
jgi:hypothetical protein